jgi:hypothetical protein
VGGARRAGAPALIGLVIAGVACSGRGRGASTVGNRAAPPASAPAPADDADPDAELPAEVRALVERWETCQHWAGEEPYDAERRQQIADGIAASCPGNEATRAELERRYADRPDVLLRFGALELRSRSPRRERIGAWRPTTHT